MLRKEQNFKDFNNMELFLFDLNLNNPELNKRSKYDVDA